MRIEGLRYVRGANVHARQPIVVARLALEGGDVVDEAAQRRLDAALADAGAVAPAPIRPDPVGFAQAAADALLAACGAPDSRIIQRRSGTLARIGAISAPLDNPTAARLALQGGVALAAAAIAGAAPQALARQAAGALAAVRGSWDGWALDVEHLEVATTCERLGVPWKRLSYLSGVLQLGEGAGQAKLFGMMTGATSNFTTRLTRDKAATGLRLLQHGYPVARTQVVTGAAEAREAMRRLGLPMVVKPRGGKWNRGVTIVYGEDQVADAYDLAASDDSGVLAESYIPGREYRILVARGGLCGAHERIAPTVVGDGRSTVSALIERANADPAHVAPEGAWGAPIQISPLTVPFLRHQGFALDAVPPAGAVVGINPLPFRKYGATYRDVTAAVHPANLQLALDVAALLEVDVAGIDIRLVDIARPWTDGPAGICDVNAGPGLDNIAVTGRAAGVDVSGRMIERIVPPAGHRPMPFVLLADLDAIPETSAAVAAAIEAALGWRVGVALPGQVRMGGREIPLPSGQGAFAAVEVLVEAPSVDAAIVAYPASGLIEHGFIRDRYDVAVLGPAIDAAATGAIMRALLGEGGTALVPALPAETMPARVAEALRGVR